MQNDGLGDVFVTKGNVEQMPGSAFEDPNNLLIKNTSQQAGNFVGITLNRNEPNLLIDF